MKKPVGGSVPSKQKKGLSLDAIVMAMENEKAMKKPAAKRKRKKKKAGPRKPGSKWGVGEQDAKPNYKGNKMGEGY